MIGDEELDVIMTTLGGQLDDAELDRRVAGFRGAMRRLRDDPAEAARIDALATDPDDDLSVAGLVALATEGDPVAWGEIVDRYAPLVWSICRRFSLSGHEIEDVAQNVWLLLVEHCGRLREPAALPEAAGHAHGRPAALLRRDQRGTEHPDRQHRPPAGPLPATAAPLIHRLRPRPWR